MIIILIIIDNRNDSYLDKERKILERLDCFCRKWCSCSRSRVEHPCRCIRIKMHAAVQHRVAYYCVYR